MNLPQKTILSLIVSVVFFAAFSLLAFTGLFDLVETRFYNPRIVKSLDREVEEFAQTINEQLNDLRDRFGETLESAAVKRSFLPNQEAEDIFERSRIYGLLLNSLPGLRTVRFVDAGGSRIHFSTLADDVLVQTGSSLSYRSYRDCPGVLPYRDVETAERQPSRIVFDSSEGQLVFSFPFTDSLDVYRGSALFTFSTRAVTERLIRQGQIGVGEELALVNSPNGFLLGLPSVEAGNLKQEAAAAWREGITLFMPDNTEAEPLALVSAKSEMGFFVGRLVQEDVLVLPPVMRFILLASFFLTTFLLIFLLLNLRQDSVTVIRTRLKQLQVSLMRQYYETKGDVDWKYWRRELERRREDIRLEVKRGLPRDKNRDIDALIDRSWDELIAFTGGHSPAEFDEERLRALIGKMLREGAPEESGQFGEPEEPEELEELAAEEEAEELVEDLTAEDAEPEEAEGLEPVDAEELEEVEVLEEIDVKNELFPGETIVTPEVFENGDDVEPAEELESLESAPENVPAGVPVSPEDLAALASRIEFGPDSPEVLSIPDAEVPEGEGKDAVELDLSSPFDSLSFESPSFSGVDEDGINFPASAEPGKKKQQIEAGGDNTGGLEEITEEGGLPLVYLPFQFQGNSRPILLRPLAEPGEGPILEQDGIHLINSDLLDPTLEATQALNPKLLRLVESVLGHEHPPE
jgi:hypothetical protein